MYGTFPPPRASAALLRQTRVLVRTGLKHLPVAWRKHFKQTGKGLREVPWLIALGSNPTHEELYWFGHYLVVGAAIVDPPEAADTVRGDVLVGLLKRDSVLRGLGLADYFDAVVRSAADLRDRLRGEPRMRRQEPGPQLGMALSLIDGGRHLAIDSVPLMIRADARKPHGLAPSTKLGKVLVALALGRRRRRSPATSKVDRALREATSDLTRVVLRSGWAVGLTHEVGVPMDVRRAVGLR